MTYAEGFAAGERAAFIARTEGAPMPMAPTVIDNEHDRGYWDAMVPRSSAWWRPQPLIRREAVVPFHFAPDHEDDEPLPAGPAVSGSQTRKITARDLRTERFHALS